MAVSVAVLIKDPALEKMRARFNNDQLPMAKFALKIQGNL